MNRKNFDAYRDEKSLKEIRVFPGRTHYLLNQKGWEEIARFTAGWLDTNALGQNKPIVSPPVPAHYSYSHF